MGGRLDFRPPVMMLCFLAILAVGSPLPDIVGKPLTHLNVDPATVVMTGLGNSADFAHQFHIAFSEMVNGACIFSGEIRPYTHPQP